MDRKKTILLMLCTLCLMLLLAACGGQPQGVVTPENGDLPPLDFGGQTKFQMLSSSEITDEMKEELQNSYGLQAETIITPWEDLTVRLATLVLSDSAPDAAMFRSDGYDYPNYIVNSLVQPVDPYLDMSHPLFSACRQYYDDTVWGDSHYLLVSGYGSSTCMFYNTKLIEDAGLESPWELYQRNAWDWDKMREYALKLTEDSDRDGVPEVYGIAVNRPFPMLYSTGKVLGDFDGKNKTFENKVTDTDIARAMTLLSDLVVKDKVCPSMISGVLEMFGEGKVAMTFGEPFYTDPSVVKIAEAGQLGICPMARDPKVDKYYVRGQVGGIWIPDGAKNPNGAVAYYAIELDHLQSDEYQEKQLKKLQQNARLSDENMEQVRTIRDPEKCVPVLELAPWADPASWLMVGNASTWEVELARTLPSVEALAEEMFKPLEVDLPLSPKTVDDFEGYGDDTAAKIAKYVALTEGSGNIQMTLDKANSQGDGKYAAKIVYDCSDAGWGSLEHNVYKTWEGNDALRLWVKGDGTPQTVTLQFNTQNGGIWRYDLQVSGTDGQTVTIPFSDFRIPEGGIEVDLDLTRITKLYLTFDGEQAGTHTLYLDDITAVKQ